MDVAVVLIHVPILRWNVTVSSQRNMLSALEALHAVNSLDARRSRRCCFVFSFISFAQPHSTAKQHVPRPAQDPRNLGQSFVTHARVRACRRAGMEEKRQQKE